jgi:hypothetical protein
MSPPATPQSRYERVCAAFVGRPQVSQEGNGFGSTALRVNGRIFAMLSSRSEFVVKLPEQRVNELIAGGQGLPFDAGKGRPMKEWVVVRPGSSPDWIVLAEEALAFVGAGRAGKRASIGTGSRLAPP